MVVVSPDVRSALQIPAKFCYANHVSSENWISDRTQRIASAPAVLPSVKLRAPSAAKSGAVEIAEKPSVCTADELHYVTAPNSDWRLALWRYKPSLKAPQRNHPLLLLSGVATNAIGYDLSPGSSFARYMSSQGYDTWTLEVRGAGLSKGRETFQAVDEAVMSESEQISSAIKHDVIGLYPEKLLPKFSDLKRLLSTKIEDFRKHIDPTVKYDWDFDHYVEDDVPAAMDYIRSQCKPKDGKLLAIGHSMGGILLYAMLSRNGFEGRDSGLVSVITLGSSLDYTMSKSSLKFLLPLVDPAQAFNVSVIPLGILLAAVYPLASRPPYVMSWLNPQISAQDMMHPELFEKLVLNNFCTVPTKLLLQLSTAFHEGGLRDRSGTFFYKDHLQKSDVPVLALAGDKDLICPPEAVYETVKVIPEELITFKVLGEPGGPHYAHYDLVGGRLAAYQVYPIILQFLSCHDMA